MKKPDYLKQPDAIDFIAWASEYLPRLSVRHSVKPWRGREGHVFEATGIEDATRQYNWPCNIDECFLPANYKQAKGVASSLEYNLATLTWLRNELRTSLTDRDALRHFRSCLAVLSWGGVDTGARATNVRFYTAKYVCDKAINKNLNELLRYHGEAHDNPGWASPRTADDDLKILNEYCSRMSSGITKIHALLEEDSVIYDSRVAAAISWIVEHYIHEKNMSSIPELLIFSLPDEQPNKNDGHNKVRRPDHKSIRPNNSILKHSYGTLSTNKPAEWMRCQLRSSWLLSGILDKSKLFDNEDSPADKFMKFQLGLFMIGYDLKQLPAHKER